MVLGDGVDDGVAENIPCAQGWSWSRADARAATDLRVEEIPCAQGWFGWMNGDLHREDGIFPVRGDGLLALAYRPQPGREGACSAGFSAGARPFGG